MFVGAIKMTDQPALDIRGDVFWWTTPARQSTVPAINIATYLQIGAIFKSAFYESESIKNVSQSYFQPLFGTRKANFLVHPVWFV